MSQGKIEAGSRNRSTVAPGAHRRRLRTPIVKNDLLPLAVLLGALFGWVAAALAVIVAAIVVLVN